MMLIPRKFNHHEILMIPQYGAEVGEKHKKFPLFIPSGIMSSFSVMVHITWAWATSSRHLKENKTIRLDFMLNSLSNDEDYFLFSYTVFEFHIDNIEFL